ALEVQCRAMGPVGHGENAICVAIVNRVEVDAFEIDLIGACQRAVAGEAKNLGAEARWLIELQHPCGGDEADRSGIRGSKLERTVRADRSHSRCTGQWLADLHARARGSIKPDDAITVRVLAQGRLSRLQ